MAQSLPPQTLGELLFCSYANLGMAHAAVTKGASSYDRVHYMVRSRLQKGLRDGTMNVRSIAEDEKLKLVLPQSCCYCGSREYLSVDHLLPRAKGGSHSGDNMVWCCRSCNSSKGSKDVLEWLHERKEFPPLLLLRRYLKLAIEICDERQLRDTPLDVARGLGLPFLIDAIPLSYPRPMELKLWVIALS